MQYEHDQTDRSPKNDQKPIFTLTHHENCANSIRETESQGLSSSSVTWLFNVDLTWITTVPLKGTELVCFRSS